GPTARADPEHAEGDGDGAERDDDELESNPWPDTDRHGTGEQQREDRRILRMDRLARVPQLEAGAALEQRARERDVAGIVAAGVRRRIEGEEGEQRVHDDDRDEERSRVLVRDPPEPLRRAAATAIPRWRDGS